MRVLYWTDSFWPRIGGSEVAAAVLIEQLRHRGHEFEVVTRQWSPDQPKTDTWLGVPVHRVPFDDGTFDRLDLQELLPLRQRVVAIKRQFRPDLVHVGLTGPSLFLHHFTSGQFPAPMLVTLHVAPTEWEYQTDRPVGEALRKATWIAPVSHAVAEQVQRRIPDMAGRCTVIHNALPDPATPLAPPGFAPPRLLCVGRVTDQKGFDTAIAAMPAVRQAFPDVQLLIAGDGDASASLRELAERLNVADCVQLIGWVPPQEVQDLIDSATLVLMPSRWEPFGLVALQTAQRSRVCLASRVDGLPEVVRHEETGLLLPVDEPDQWAAAISALLRDRQRIITLGQQAQQWASRQFKLSDHVDAYESLYRQLAGGRCRAEAMA